MHCPKCGQEQLSSEIRYCSRCGFPLAGVSSLLARGGTVELDQQPRESPRRRGVKQGAILVFVAFGLAPLLAPLFEEFGAMVIGSLFMAGLLRMLFAAIFEEGASAQPPFQASQQPYSIPSPQFAPQQQVLPPYTPPVDLPRRVDTAEHLEPPSVTENTTRLLENEKEPEH